jgi:hypothetical protein
MNGRKQIVWLVVVALVATIAFVLVGNSVAARPSEIE